jgi:hypothetical protein
MKKQNQIVFYFNKVKNVEGKISYHLSTNRDTPSMYLGGDLSTPTIKATGRVLMDCLLRMNLKLDLLNDVKVVFTTEYKFECKARRIGERKINLKFGQLHVPMVESEIFFFSKILFAHQGELNV